MPATFESPELIRVREQLLPVTNRADRRVLALLGYLSAQDLTAVRDIRSIAASMNLSQSRLRSIFKEHAGISISRYIKRLRLHQARSLLQQTMLTVKEVMAEVGVADHSHFARDYKKLFGESPSSTRDKQVGMHRTQVFSPQDS